MPWLLHKNFRSPILKPLIFQDMFLTPKVAPLIIQLCERLGQGAQEWVDVVCAGLGQVPAGRNEN